MQGNAQHAPGQADRAGQTLAPATSAAVPPAAALAALRWAKTTPAERSAHALHMLKFRKTKGKAGSKAAGKAAGKPAAKPVVRRPRKSA